MHPTRSFTISLLALVALFAFSGQAFATFAAVGSCTPPNAVTPAHTYPTIQAAVTASAPGTTIQICPGSYPEQVNISKKLTLLGVIDPTAPTQDLAIILPPTGGMVANATDVDTSEPIAAQVFVHDTFAAVVMISNVTVDGTGNQFGCVGDLTGILYQNASGTLNHIAVRNELLGDVLSPCQSGEGIFVQSGTGKSSKVTVENSSVHNYNKNGIIANDAGTKMNLTENFIQGSGSDPNSPAQNGIQIGFGATGTIVSETISDNLYFDPASYAAADILIVDAAENSGITVKSNTLGNTQQPITIYTDFSGGPTQYGDGVSITGNHIYGTGDFDAIDICTNGNTVTGNTIFNSAQSGIHLDSACGIFFSGPPTGNNNTVTGNTLLESACAGILADTGTTSNTITPNTFYTMPFTVTNTAASCTIPLVPGQANSSHADTARPNVNKSPRKYSPKK